MRATGFRLDPDWDIAGTVGSRGVASISFDFSNEWQGLAKRLTFYPKGETTGVSILMQSDDEEILLPPEAYSKPGETTFVIDGVGNNGVKLITLRGRLRILDTAPAGGGEPSEPSPTEVEQIMLALSELTDKTERLDGKLDPVEGDADMEDNIAVLTADGKVTDSGLSVDDVLTEHPQTDVEDDTTLSVKLDNGGNFGVISDIERDENGHVKSVEYGEIELPRRRSIHIGTEPKYSVPVGTEYIYDQGEYEIGITGRYTVENNNSMASGIRTQYYITTPGDDTPALVAVMFMTQKFTSYIRKGQILHVLGNNVKVTLESYASGENGDVPEYREGDYFLNSESGDLFVCTAEQESDTLAEWEYTGKLPENLPVATPTVLGGVRPVAKEDYMTVPVGIDSTNGRLYTVLWGSSSVDSWADVQRIVRSGLASQVFEIGDQLTCEKNGETLTWDIIGFDHDIPAEQGLEHSMTLQLHSAIGAVQYDAGEAVYFAEEGLAAGTYHFKLTNGYLTSYGGGRMVEFTVDSEIPAGALICFEWPDNTDASDATVKIYSDRTCSVCLDSVNVDYGEGGTLLENTNNAKMVRCGNGRWRDSAIRQYLNSTDEAGEVWTPKNDFDLAPVWADTLPGFLNGIDPDFLSVIGNVRKKSQINTGSETGLEETEDKVYLLSLSEVYGNPDDPDSEMPFEYYSENTQLTEPGNGENAVRKKYYGTESVIWLLRDGRQANQNVIMFVNKNGTVGYTNANGSVGYCIPACCIV